MSTRWNKESEEFFKDNWGKHDIYVLARMITKEYSINRTVTALKKKAVRLGIGGTIENSNLISAIDVSKVMGVYYKTVYSWIDKGLPCRKQKLSGTRPVRMIEYKHLIKWLKNNPKLWDARRIDMDYFKPEMVWIKPKLEYDKQRGKAGEDWNELEKQRAYMLFQRGLTKKQIAKELNRTYKGIELMLSRMIDQYRKSKKSGEQVRKAV